MSSSRPKLILVDGTAVLYRSFHAIKELSTRDGRPTNALFGFIKKLRQTEDSLRPTHWAVVLDGGLPAERVALLPEYKAQRPPMPDALRGQVDLAVEYLSRSGIAMVRKGGVEGDDLMASLAAWAEADSSAILLVTSDKDMYQIVTEKIRILPTASEAPEMGPREVEEKTGVTPQQIPDWLALTGDTVDNIPGVPGVGAKTAAKLLQRFRTAENLMRHLDEVDSERIRAALAAHRDAVSRNLQMVRLHRDIPCGVGWRELERVPANAERLVPFLRDLEFESLIRPMEQGQGELPLG